MSKKSTGHVVINSQTSCFECRHCGASQEIPFPVAIKMMSVMAKEFLRAHRNCKEPKR